MITFDNAEFYVKSIHFIFHLYPTF